MLMMVLKKHLEHFLLAVLVQEGLSQTCKSKFSFLLFSFSFVFSLSSFPFVSNSTPLSFFSIFFSSFPFSLFGIFSPLISIKMSSASKPILDSCKIYQQHNFSFQDPAFCCLLFLSVVTQVPVRQVTELKKGMRVSCFLSQLPVS